MQVKRPRTKARYIILALAIIAGMIMYIRRGGGEEPIIQTAVVERGTVTASVSATGVLQPLTTVEVKSNAGGQVIKLAVDEGDEVNPGQLIARIDPSDTLTAYEQSQSDLAAAVSKVDQARHQLTMQRTQNSASIESAQQNLESARAKLIQAREQAQIQPKLTIAAISQAKSNLAAAKASLAQTKTALIPQKISSAQAGYDQAKASCDAALKDFNRQKELLNKGYVAKSVVDASEEKYSVAKAQLDSAKRKLDTINYETDQDMNNAQAKVDQAQAALDNAIANSVQDKVKKHDFVAAQAAERQAEAALQSAIAGTNENTIRQGDIVQANAQVQRSQAEVRNTKIQLDYTTIVAPRAGIVTKKYVEEGSIVTAGRSSFSGTGSGVAIVDIADISRMFALIDVDETDIAQIEVGQKVDVTVEAYPDELFEGRVTKIAPQSVTDQNVTTIPVTVEIDLPDARLKPGMSVTCDFITGRAEDVLMVPSEAVSESNDGNTVTVMDHGLRITRKVEVGLAGSDYTEIKKGLKLGEKVVTAVIEPTGSGNMSGGGMGPGGLGGGMRR